MAASPLRELSWKFSARTAAIHRIVITERKTNSISQRVAAHIRRFDQKMSGFLQIRFRDEQQYYFNKNVINARNE